MLTSLVASFGSRTSGGLPFDDPVGLNFGMDMSEGCSQCRSTEQLARDSKADASNDTLTEHFTSRCGEGGSPRPLLHYHEIGFQVFSKSVRPKN